MFFLLMGKDIQSLTQQNIIYILEKIVTPVVLPQYSCTEPLHGAVHRLPGGVSPHLAFVFCRHKQTVLGTACIYA